MNYSIIDENQIVSLCKTGDEEAFAYILEKYKNLVRMKAGELYVKGGDRDDLIQEGMIGLYKAVMSFNEDRETSFSTFATLCVHRQMINAVRASRCKKHEPLNTSVSYDRTVVTKSGEEEYYTDIAGIVKDRSPEDAFIDRESAIAFNENITANLSKYEKQVFDLHLSGHSYTQIAEILKKSPKSVDNALSRIKVKVHFLLLRNS